MTIRRRACGMIVQVEREHAHEARERFHSRHHERRGSEHDFALGKPVAVDLGFGQMRDEVVGRVLPPQRDFRREEIAQFLEGGDVLRVATFDGLVGRDREDDLASDVGVIALGQAHRPEQQPDRDLAGKVIDEIEPLARLDAIERAVRDFFGGSDQMLDVLARERCLAERPQPVVARRIGGAQSGAGAARKLVDQVALARREGFPVACRLHDIVVAGKDPKLAALAPVAGMLFAQDLVAWKRIGIDFRRIEIECFHRR